MTIITRPPPHPGGEKCIEEVGTEKLTRKTGVVMTGRGECSVTAPHFYDVVHYVGHTGKCKSIWVITPGGKGGSFGVGKCN